MKIDEEAFLKKLAGIIDDPDIEKTALDEIGSVIYGTDF